MATPMDERLNRILKLRGDLQTAVCNNGLVEHHTSTKERGKALIAAAERKIAAAPAADASSWSPEFTARAAEEMAAVENDQLRAHACANLVRGTKAAKELMEMGFTPQELAKECGVDVSSPQLVAAIELRTEVMVNAFDRLLFRPEARATALELLAKNAAASLPVWCHENQETYALPNWAGTFDAEPTTEALEEHLTALLWSRYPHMEPHRVSVNYPTLSALLAMDDLSCAAFI